MIGHRLLEAAGEIAARAPRVTYAAAGPLAQPFRPWGGAALDPEEIRTVLPELSPRAARAAARLAWSDHVRTRLLSEARRRRGRAAVAPLLVDDGGLSRLDAPTLLVSFHLGPWQLMPTALDRFPEQLLMLQEAEGKPRLANRTIHSTSGEDGGRRAFLASLGELRAGRSVFAAIDGPPRTVPAPLFGGEIELVRGPLALSRLSGVPITPFGLTWERRRGRVVVGDPIGPFDDEAEGAAAVGAWLEAYLREDPTRLTAHLLAQVIRARPPAGAHASARGAPSR